MWDEKMDHNELVDEFASKEKVLCHKNQDFEQLLLKAKKRSHIYIGSIFVLKSSNRPYYVSI